MKTLAIREAHEGLNHPEQMPGDDEVLIREDHDAWN